MTTIKMDKYQIMEVLTKGQWYFMFGFSTLFGVLANESYIRLKYPDKPRWNNFFAKVCVAGFVCLLVHAVYEYKKYDPKYEYAPILLCSFLYYQVGTWIVKSLFPIISKIMVNLLTGGKKDDE